VPLKTIIGLTLGLLSISALTASPVVLTNGPASLGSGSEMTAWIQAENFSLPTNTLIDGVIFRAFIATFGAGYSGSVAYQIYSNSAGLPGSLLLSGTANPIPVATGAVGVSSSVYPEFILSFGITPFLATAGTQYWLGLHNGPLSLQTRDEFYWEGALPNTGNQPTGLGDPAPFDGNFSLEALTDHAFQLTGTEVPEPSTVPMIAVGLLAIAASRRSSWVKPFPAARQFSKNLS